MNRHEHVLAILEAQWRIYRNYLGKSRLGVVANALVGLIWYGSWTFAGVAAAKYLPLLPVAEVGQVLPLALMGMFFFWQIFPILLVSSGVALDLRKLRPYPIPLADLMWIEVLLRVTACVEMLLVLIGLGIGLLRHPRIAWWGSLWLLPYLFFNLFLSTGLRDLLARVFARKRYRELISILVLTLIALPQIMLSRAASGGLRWTDRLQNFTFWPWAAVGSLARAHFSWSGFAYTCAWLAASFAFARWQFQRSYSFDEDATGVRTSAPRRFGFTDALFTFPSRVLPDPLAAIIEKELRFLSRAPRFRVLFMMGFSFGLLIFMPTFLRSREQSGFFSSNFLTMVGGYALILLGEVLFWNNLGFDRSAVATYFVTPVRFRTVLIGKNIAALCYVLLEVLILTALCSAFRLTLSPSKVAEAFAVLLMLTLFLAAMGNIRSVQSARPINPTQAMRGPGAGRAQFTMMLLYPVALIPAALPFGARYAFDSDLAFYLVLGLDLIIGVIVYAIALDSAERNALQRQEELITELSQGEGLVSS